MRRESTIAAFADRPAEWVGNEIFGVLATAEALAEIDVLEIVDDTTDAAFDPENEIACYDCRGWVIAVGPGGRDRRQLEEAARLAADHLDCLAVVAMIDTDTWRLAVYEGNKLLERYVPGPHGSPEMIARRLGLDASAIDVLYRDPRPEVVPELWRALGLPLPTETTERPSAIVRGVTKVPWELLWARQ